MSLTQTEKNDRAKGTAGEDSHRPTNRGRAALVACVGAAALLAAVVVSVSWSSDNDIAQPNQAVSGNVPPSFAFHRPSMATDPVRPGHLAMASMEGTRLETCYLGLSGDGGKTWTNLAFVGAGGRGLPTGTTKCWNPSVTYGPDGTLYYAVQSRWPNNATGKEVLLYVSDDGGLRFRAPVALDSEAEGESGWWPDVAVDSNSGRVYVAWSRRPDARPLPGRVMLSSSTDRGLTFSPPVAVTPAEQTSTSGALLAVGPDAKIYLSYQDHTAWLGSSGKEPAQLHVAVSSDQGQSFAVSQPIRPVVPGCIVTRGFECDPLHGDGPWMLNSIAAGPSPGQVFLGWWDKEHLGDQAPARVLFSSSTNGGVTWAPPRVVGIPPRAEDAQQHRPWLSVAPDGRLDIAYFSQAPGGAQDVYWISSADAGWTFSPPRKLTDQASDANVGPPHFFGQGVRAGDYLALVSAEDGVLAAWTDTRRGCALSQHQDVFFTSRDLDERDPRTPAPEHPQSSSSAPPVRPCFQ